MSCKMQYFLQILRAFTDIIFHPEIQESDILHLGFCIIFSVHDFLYNSCFKSSI